MKKILLFLGLILGQVVFSQGISGIIVDKDGFVNVRKKPSAKSEIKGTIKTGEVVGISDVFFDEKHPNWTWVMYNSGANIVGYVHKSRVKFLEDLFPKIPFQKKQGKTLVFKNKDAEIQISTKQISFLKDIKPYVSGEYGEQYKGKQMYGIDGTLGYTDNFPVEVFDKITLKIGEKTIEIPQEETENIFIVDREGEDYSCYWDKDRNRFFIEAIVGDGAGAVGLLLIFENGEFKEKLFIDII